MADGHLTYKIDVTPGEDTMRLVLALLDLWQDAHPDEMIAMVPDRDRYKYEIIQRERGTETEKREME